MKINKKMVMLYPTQEVMQKHRDKYRSWKCMATGTGVSIDTLNAHRKFLGMKVEQRGGWAEKYNDLSFDEILVNIKDMLKGTSKNVYDKYLIVDEGLFYKNQIGYDGLNFLGTFEGTTWKNKNMPSAIVRGHRSY